MNNFERLLERMGLNEALKHERRAEERQKRKDIGTKELLLRDKKRREQNKFNPQHFST